MGRAGLLRGILLFCLTGKLLHSFNIQQFITEVRIKNLEIIYNQTEKKYLGRFGLLNGILLFYSSGGLSSFMIYN